MRVFSLPPFPTQLLFVTRGFHSVVSVFFFFFFSFPRCVSLLVGALLCSSVVSSPWGPVVAGSPCYICNVGIKSLG